MDKISKAQITFLIKPMAFLVVVAVLFVSVAAIAFNQLSSLIQKNEEAKILETKLTQKVMVLEKVTNIISGDMTFLDIVVPYKASVLYALSQVKNQSLKYGLILSNLKTGSPAAEKGDIDRIALSFDIEGQESSIYEFIASFQKLLPLMNVNKIKINTTGGIVRANINLFVYSAPLPKTIPSVSAAATDLTDQEIKMIVELSTYGLPAFVEPKSTDGYLRADPFN